LRRTLEVLCDELESPGDDLRQRIEGLRGRVTLPETLFEAITEIRLLGNDAAHVKARNYATVKPTPWPLPLALPEAEWRR
jgi:hypothetical protein